MLLLPLDVETAGIDSIKDMIYDRLLVSGGRYFLFEFWFKGNFSLRQTNCFVELNHFCWKAGKKC